ncbi:glutaryl-CoA dehydrogenase [Microbacterium sp. Gd 4-13]|uniref:acyl-CoA dehydrogenase family protein n=1 Tax=Microbacterium sp. Gd 4-13 TaxID=2173179 RepID=UPI000D585A35|nr:acyl-CoA dehydrogenase family protein [Microbacterium sp. Gd 4-13]PVW02703.1 glutaryl-CoA dehydrogenase [Microbacterium sp. Gd 4-13]
MTALYPVSDLYGFADLLTDAETAKLRSLRELLETQLAPILPDFWERAASPVRLREPLRDLRLVDDPALLGSDGRTRELYNGFRAFEFSRTDISTGMLFHGQTAMFRELVRQGGSDEQVAAWDDAIVSFEMTGCFALTEPDHGSDVAGGLATTARREGEEWILDGAKRWIGNAAFSEFVGVFARDVADGQVKVFLARTDDPGMTLTTIERKAALRLITNSDISLEGVRVPESHRLQRVSSFADVSALFRTLRPDIAWIAAGAQAGAYEAALRYTLSREQFGRPIAGFQLVQDKLVRMLGNVTASLGMAVRLAERRQAGVSRDEDSALAKVWLSDRLRETVAWAREVVGGNGIVIDNDVARFFTDAEAVYTYEGTREINTLIVGRAVTGLSAFTR